MRDNMHLRVRVCGLQRINRTIPQYPQEHSCFNHSADQYSCTASFFNTPAEPFYCPCPLCNTGACLFKRRSLGVQTTAADSENRQWVQAVCLHNDSGVLHHCPTHTDHTLSEQKYACRQADRRPPPFFCLPSSSTSSPSSSSTTGAEAPATVAAASRGGRRRRGGLQPDSESA